MKHQLPRYRPSDIGSWSVAIGSSAVAIFTKIHNYYFTNSDTTTIVSVLSAATPDQTDDHAYMVSDVGTF